MNLVTRDDYADAITDAWSRSVQALVEAGELLEDARQEFEHGEYETMVSEELPFGINTAHRLRSIACHETLSKVAHAPFLPDSRSTLYEISKLPAEEAEKLIDREVITPETNRSQARRIVQQYKTEQGKEEANGTGLKTETAPDDRPRGAQFHPDDEGVEWRDTGRDVPKNEENHLSKERTDWETPEPFFQALDEEFDFEWDLAANDRNAKCDRYYTADDNGLQRPWKGRCFLNPPYSDVEKWAARAVEQTRNHDQTLVVALLASRTGARWWHQYAMQANEVRFVRKRLNFKGGSHSATFWSAVIIWRQPSPEMPQFRTIDREGNILRG